MTSLSPRTAAERNALAYQADVHPAVRPLLDVIAQLHEYQPRDAADAAMLLRSLGGIGDGGTNAVAEIGELVKELVRNSVLDGLPGAERAFVREQSELYSDVVLQGEGEDTLNQVVHAVEGHAAPGSGLWSRTKRALGGGR
ncbi:hypothetical protein [Streptomyces sp. NPDC001404]|uniref:hypothetical protein n=1 Tax=Streptomyces sp. NPDC001404 TaxID=3364571 RepID=UPI00368F9B53